MLFSPHADLGPKRLAEEAQNPEDVPIDPSGKIFRTPSMQLVVLMGYDWQKVTGRTLIVSSDNIDEINGMTVVERLDRILKEFKQIQADDRYDVGFYRALLYHPSITYSYVKIHAPDGLKKLRQVCLTLLTTRTVQFAREFFAGGRQGSFFDPTSIVMMSYILFTGKKQRINVFYELCRAYFHEYNEYIDADEEYYFVISFVYAVVYMDYNLFTTNYIDTEGKFYSGILNNLSKDTTITGYRMFDFLAQNIEDKYTELPDEEANKIKTSLTTNRFDVKKYMPACVRAYRTEK